MSEHSIYLREQADKCRGRANAIHDARTQRELRKLAAEGVDPAQEVETKEKQ